LKTSGQNKEDSISKFDTSLGLSLTWLLRIKVDGRLGRRKSDHTWLQEDKMALKIEWP
jgi:hypothetical protein